MRCPFCGAVTDVVESRYTDGVTRRRRLCFNEHKFTTLEKPVLDKVTVTAAEWRKQFRDREITNPPIDG